MREEVSASGVSSTDRRLQPAHCLITSAMASDLAVATVYSESVKITTPAFPSDCATA
ncbi:hypothetical protein D3C78_1623120 [compost metagenome]